MAEALANRLPSGHDEEFVSEVEDDFHCLICHLPLKEPVLTRCGHRFCKECIEDHLRRQEVQALPFTCPADMEGLDRDRDVFPDKATERKILSFEIKCPFQDCDWIGKLKIKEIHLETCPSKVVFCTYNNCHMTLKRRDLEEHVTITCKWRIIECEYCREPHPKCHMQDHTEKCNKFPLPCPNSCGGSTPREMITNHIENDCPLTLVSCPYVQMGCNEKVQRKNVPSHLQLTMQEHLDFACAKLNNTQTQLDETQVLLNETQVQLSATQNQLSNTSETTRNLEEKVAALLRQLDLKGKTDSLTRKQLSNTQETINNLEEKAAALQQQLSNTQGKAKKIEGKLVALQKQLELKEITERSKQEQLENRVEALQRQLEIKTKTRFMWKIDMFSEILSQVKAEIRDTVESDPFYTESFGYKLKVVACPNGAPPLSWNTHLLVAIFLMKGEYDALLPWPANRKVTITLIDQQEDPEKRENVVHHLSPKRGKQYSFLKRQEGEERCGALRPCFISHKKLQTGRYLVDDTLFIQVEIGPP